MTERFRIRERADVGREAWDAFAEASDEAWLWHRYDLQDALATWPGSRDKSFAVFDTESGKDEIAAIVPLRLTSRKVLPFYGVGVLHSLGGPAFRNGIGKKMHGNVLKIAINRWNQIARTHRGLDFNLALSPMSSALRGDHCPLVNPLLSLGCNNTLTQTWVVDLRIGKEALWKHLEGRARTAVRKAEKQGVTIRLTDQADDADRYYQLHVDTYRRTGVPPHPKAYFDAIWKDFVAHGLARIWFAEVEGNVVAAANFGVYKHAAIYWTGASSERGLETEASSMLQWHAMQWMTDHGLEWCETGEAFPHIKQGKSKGLNDFKKSFGGTMYPYFKGNYPLNGVVCSLYRMVKAWQA